MNSLRRRVVSSGIAVALSAAAACSGRQAASTRAPLASDIAATVGSATVTMAELDAKALQQPTSRFQSMKLSQALFDARRAALQEMVGELLLEQEAKARNTDSAILIQQEITNRVPAVTDAEITTWYQENQGRLQGTTLDQVRDGVRVLLTQQRTALLRSQYLERLQTRTPVRIMLEPPRQPIDITGRPSKGPADAPIVMVEFSDFQCPFCLTAFPTVSKVLATYGDRIHFVYRHYPLTNHPAARPSAEASECALEQGKFWEYHDSLFNDVSHLGDVDLKARAGMLGLNTRQFDACVDSRKYRSKVEADQKAGDEAGVSGTPAFFINGRILDGARPYESFKQLIDEELAMTR